MKTCAHRDTDTQEKLRAGVGAGLEWGPWGERLRWGLPGKECSRREHSVRQWDGEGQEP